jgi:uncharacterized membrane protein
MSEIFEREPEYGNSAGRVNLTLYNGTKWREARLDKYTRATTTIDYSHHEIHDGSHFFISNVVSLSINNVYDFEIVTANATNWMHFLFSIQSESQTAWWIYEGVTILTAGTLTTAFNNDRNSATTSNAIFRGTINSNLAAAIGRINTASALKIEQGIIGAGQDAGSASREEEIILKQNTSYLCRAVANVAGYLDFKIAYYHHTNREV